MRTFALILVLISSIFIKAQSTLTENQITEKLDSILFEGNLLYRYEKAAWISIDMARDNRKVKNSFSNYLVYLDNDTIKSIILNKNSDCIYELKFVFQFEKPVSDVVLTRPLSSNEKKLVSTKAAILNKIVENKISLECPEGFGLNMIMMPKEDGFKFYIISGSNKSGIIPFGNDYLFLTDNYGNIQSWKKFHSRLIALESKGPEGEDVREMIHSHLRTEPFISATDVCTFMLYAKLCGLNSFQVYSPELSKYFRYRLDKNKIEIVEDEE